MAGTVSHVLLGAWAESAFPTFTAFLPRSKGHLSQASPANTQLSKGCLMWSGQSLLTKLSLHWETNFARLNNVRIKNVFSSLLPYSSVSKQWVQQWAPNASAKFPLITWVTIPPLLPDYMKKKDNCQRWCWFPGDFF